MPHTQRKRSTRAGLGLGLGPAHFLLGGPAIGTLEQIQWGERGLELSPGAALIIGVVLFAGVGVAVRSLTKRNEQFEGSSGSDRESGTETETPAVLTGDAIEGTQVVLRRDDGDWRWRVLRLEALAESPTQAPTESTATDRIERTRDAIDTAEVREVTDGAVRLYCDADGCWRWSLVSADGTRVGAAAEGYDDREAAAAAVSRLQDCGPEADVVDVEEAAITIANRCDRWQWKLVDDERTPLAAGTDGYERRADATAAAETFVDRIADARVLEVDTAGVELYESEAIPEQDSASNADSASETETTSETGSTAEPESEPRAPSDEAWTWRLVDEDSEVVADASIEFERRSAAEDAATTALAALEDAAVTETGEAAFERYPAADGGGDADDDAWRWRLVDDAGRTVARAPDAVATVDEAERATELVREAAPDAAVLEIDDAAYEVYPGPTGDRLPDFAGSDEAVVGSKSDENGMTEATEATTAVTDGSGTAGLTTAGEGWRWRLVTADRDVVAESATSYDDAEAATTALDRIRDEAREADVVAFETAAFRVYENEDGDWRWRLLDEGGIVLEDSDGEHDSRNEAIEAMVTLKERAPDAEVVEIDAPAFELFTAEGGDEENDEAWAWRLIDAAGRRVAEAPTTYASRAAARAAVDRVRDQSAAPVHTVESATFQPYATDDGDAWRWRFVCPTGETLAVSEPEYTTRDELGDRIDEIRETAAAARAYTTGDVIVQLAGDETWTWRLLDRNRKPILESTTPYSSREAARDAVDDLEKASTSDVPVFTIGPESAVVWLEAETDGWRWTLLDRDREALATATETTDKSAATATVEDVQRLAPLAERIDVTEASFDVVERDDGWRWRLLDDDGTPIAIGEEARATKAAARESIDDVRSLLESANVFELQGPAFERYRTDSTEPWRWRLVDETGETLLESEQTYETRAATQTAIAALQSHATGGEVTVAE